MVHRRGRKRSGGGGVGAATPTPKRGAVAVAGAATNAQQPDKMMEEEKEEEKEEGHPAASGVLAEGVLVKGRTGTSHSTGSTARKRKADQASAARKRKPSRRQRLFAPQPHSDGPAHVEVYVHTPSAATSQISVLPLTELSWLAAPAIGCGRKGLAPRRARVASATV
eukprot:COSAG01_NODE_11306_length_1962_cov_1.798175_2_plen_167_part_00